MAQSHDAAGPPALHPVPRTRKPGEVRSRSGCATCKQRRKKCDEDFRIRHNGATSCNRCADRGIHCELSSNATPQRATPQQQRQRPSPYPTSGGAEAPSRAVRGTGAASAAQHADGSSAASTSAAPLSSTAVDAATNPFTSILDPTQSWKRLGSLSIATTTAAAASHCRHFPKPAKSCRRDSAGLDEPELDGAESVCSPLQSTQHLARGLVERRSRSSRCCCGHSQYSWQPFCTPNAVDMNALFNMLNNNAARGSGCAKHQSMESRLH